MLRKAVAAAFLVIALSACKTLDLPPITIAVPAPAPVVAPSTDSPKPKPQATLAFAVSNECSGAAIETAIANIPDVAIKQANSDGYVALVLDAGGSFYSVSFEAEGYESTTRKFQLDDNRQFPITLKPVGGCPKPEPKPEPAPTPAPVPAPPVVTPQPTPTPVPAPTPSVLCAKRESDPEDCARQVAAKYPQLLQINTADSTTEFTQRVLEVLGEPWGHVGKTAGEGQGVPRGFSPIMVKGSDGVDYRITGVSYDAIKNRLTGAVIDMLGNATANEPCTLAPADCWKPGPASVHWDSVPSQFWRVNNPYIPAIPVR